MQENGKSMKIVTKNQEEPRKEKLGRKSIKKNDIKNPNGIRKRESKNEILFSR